ncbi:MAG: response regulator transcription factor [Chitinophagaceae bacterium]|nr:response regulator transcription factor [Chitinophagaceae bacterium]
MDKKTKIIIVDDHTLVSNALADLINGIEEFDVAYQLKNGKELMDKLNIMNELPHIILLDINMPVMNGFETMEILSREYPGIKVLALSMNDDEISIIKMMRSGACGFISKIMTEDELIIALKSVKTKGFYYSDKVTNLIVNNFKTKENNSPILFTDREMELMQYICTDLTYKEIAEKMNVSPKTVDGYRDNLFNKLDIKSRIGLAIYIIKNEIVKL